jgi:hypothetical protein
MTPDRQPRPSGVVDTSLRDASGAYERHVVETVLPPEDFSVVEFLASA